MKINVSTPVSFLLLLLLGCQEEIGGEVQKVVVEGCCQRESIC
jgi:hypothetical protein